MHKRTLHRRATKICIQSRSDSSSKAGLIIGRTARRQFRLAQRATFETEERFRNYPIGRSRLSEYYGMVCDSYCSLCWQTLALREAAG